MEVVADLTKALLGFERKLKHLDGRIINISRTGTTQPDEVEVIEGEGVSSHYLVPHVDLRSYD